MNLLFVADVSIENVIGGAERVLHEQTTRLARRGHRVHLITRRLPEHRRELQTIDGVAEIRCDFDPHGGIRSIVRNRLQARRHLDALHQPLPTDCLNAHQPLAAFGLMSQAAALGLPAVYTCHSLWAEEYLSRNTECAPAGRALRRVRAWGRNWIEGRVLRRCTRIVALSRFTQTKLQRVHGIPEEQVVVVPGGVDLVKFHPAADKAAVRGALGLPVGRYVAFTVRNLVPRMGLDRLVLAMQEVARRIPAALLIIGGQGPMRAELESMINRLGLRHHVRLAGFIPEEALVRHYQAADLFVLPSRELEGFGMVTLEALACGLPVLGTQVGGTREILARWDERFLLNDGLPETLARGIVECRQRFDPGRGEAASIPRTCRSFAETHYAWDRHLAALEAVFEDAWRWRGRSRSLAPAGKAES